MEPVYVRFPTLHDLNACFQLDGLVETTHVWQVQRTGQGDRFRVTFQRVRLPRPLRLPYPAPGDALRQCYEVREGIWVAIVQGQVRGFVQVTWDTEESLGWVRHLVVDRAWRGQGIGTALLRRVAQVARDRDADRLVVCVNAKNDPAIQFLLRQGFSFVGYNEVFFNEGDMAIYLGRSVYRWG